MPGRPRSLPSQPPPPLNQRPGRNPPARDGAPARGRGQGEAEGVSEGVRPSPCGRSAQPPRPGRTWASSGSRSLTPSRSFRSRALPKRRFSPHPAPGRAEPVRWPLGRPLPARCPRAAADPVASAARRAAGAALRQVWVPGLGEAARARARAGRTRRRSRNRGQSVKSTGRLQPSRTPLNRERDGWDEKVGRGAMRRVVVEENQGLGAPRCFRSCLGCKREILELMAPQGSHLPTLEGSAGHTINLTYGVGGTGRGSGLLSPLLAAASGCQEKQTPSPLPWPDWAGRQRKRKGLEDSDIVSLRFLQANRLEVNYYSDVLKEKIPANIYGML